MRNVYEVIVGCSTIIGLPCAYVGFHTEVFPSTTNDDYFKV
jgi:hypothetical protein